MPTARVLHGDCLDVLVDLLFEDFQADAVVCDPPYHLASIVKRFGKAGSALAQFGKDGAFARASRGFMGKTWDGGDVACNPETWKRVYEVMKPGAHLLAFGGTRTYHRMACAIEDAGFEIRDCVQWLYGQGFPKSHDVSRDIDRIVGFHERDNPCAGKAGFRNLDGENVERGQIPLTTPATEAARQWHGWGTALKPAVELVCVARKPLSEQTVAANVLAHGVGGINVDKCRIPTCDDLNGGAYCRARQPSASEWADHNSTIHNTMGRDFVQPLGRWPANVTHDGSPEVLEAFAAFGERKSPATYVRSARAEGTWLHAKAAGTMQLGYADTGTAARFFYCAKASKSDRAGSKHTTVKPLALMSYLCKLVCPPGGMILDPFAGSGTTGEAAILEGFNAVLIEREAEYITDIQRRLDRVKEWM